MASERALAAALLVLLAASAALAKPPSWDRKIDSPKRFKVLKAFGGEAVLDQETGIVWQRVPSADALAWDASVQSCRLLLLGGRRGWRLPHIEELATLGDESFSLPAGHPFTILGSTQYWSATTLTTNTGPNTGFAAAASFPGSVAGAQKALAGIVRHWCVRGGTSVDDQ